MSAAPGRSLLSWLSVRAMIAATVVFVIADTGDQLAGGSVVVAGLSDETAHLLTTLFVFWAIGGVLWDRLLIPALIASVTIDLDHMPQYLGYRFLTEGTPRPYTHSLLTVASLLVVAVLWSRRREMLIGVVLGLSIHFWRDMAEPGSGVALLWPCSDDSFSLPHLSYLAVMAVVIAAGTWRSLTWETKARAARAEGREKT